MHVYNVSRTDVERQLDEHGFVIIENRLDPSRLRSLRHEIDAHLGSTRPDADNAFMGSRTKRFGRCLQRLPTSRVLVRDPLVEDLVRHTLLPISPTVQVHFTGVMHLMEGQPAQVLHRDVTPFANPSHPVVVAAMWAVTDFDEENGATIVVPGSHRWPEERRPKRSELVAATMPAGSVMVYVGNLIHGAGECRRGERTGLNLQYSVGWLRQEENQYLAVDPEVASTFDDDLLRLMGYDLAAKHWGYVDQAHPLRHMRGDPSPGGLAPDGYQFEGRTRALRIDVGQTSGSPYYPIEDV